MPDMPNNIYAPEGAFEDAKEGDEVQMQVTGIYHDDDQGKWVEVSTVDGQPVGGSQTDEMAAEGDRTEMMGAMDKLEMKKPWGKTEENY